MISQKKINVFTQKCKVKKSVKIWSFWKMPMLTFWSIAPKVLVVQKSTDYVWIAMGIAYWMHYSTLMYLKLFWHNLGKTQSHFFFTQSLELVLESIQQVWNIWSTPIYDCHVLTQYYNSRKWEIFSDRTFCQSLCMIIWLTCKTSKLQRNIISSFNIVGVYILTERRC